MGVHPLQVEIGGMAAAKGDGEACGKPLPEPGAAKSAVLIEHFVSPDAAGFGADEMRLPGLEFQLEFGYQA